MTHAAPDTEEHRAATRRRALIAAKIRYSGGAVTIDCVLRNISDTGAKLEVSEGVSLPSTFELSIPQKNVIHRCELRWRRAGEAGIAFLDAYDTPAGPGDPLAMQPGRHEDAASSAEEVLKARIRRLEAEIARLQARIVDLGGA